MQSKAVLDAINGIVEQSPPVVRRSLEYARFDTDPPHTQPSAPRLVAATAASVALSLVVDYALVRVGTRMFPSTAGYVHFRFGDYASLTVIGVLAACAGWPIVTRLSAAPRWLFLRLAVIVSLVLLLPDAWLLYLGQAAKAVAVLAAMHIAIAVVTYNTLVRVAPVGRPSYRALAHLRVARSLDVDAPAPTTSSAGARSEHPAGIGEKL
ncbi:MAG: hypothetical protein ACP5VR_02250 [Acidimicrobiales bacterium]